MGIVGIGAIREFLRLCVLINLGLLVFWAVIMVFARDWVYNIHNKWFPMTKETHTVLIYSFLGVYKIFFIIFALIPYIALVLMK